MRWILQSNLGSTAELARLRDAVRASGAELVEEIPRGAPGQFGTA